MFLLHNKLFSLHDDIMTGDGCSIKVDKSLFFGASPPTNFDSCPTEPLARSLEPTPIGPKGVAAVPSFPLHEQVIQSSDISGVDTLQQLFGADGLQAYQPTCTDVSSMPPFEGCKLTRSMVEQKHRFGTRQTAQWNKRFQELVDFHRKHGHCLVPMHGYESPELSNWVKRQRSQYRRKVEWKRHTLCDRRQRALEGLGFVWDMQSSCWNERYQELHQFWRESGHCKVPKSYKKNPALAVWVKCQRRQYKMQRLGGQSCMSEERVRLLKELDFDFAPRRDSTTVSLRS